MFTDETLTEAERKVVAARASGVSADFRDDDASSASRDGAAWDASRTVRAEVLGQLLTSGPGARPDAQAAVAIVGARIRGELALEDVSLTHPLLFEECYFDQDILLANVQAPRVAFTRCDVPGIHAHGLRTEGDISLRGTRAEFVAALTASVGGLFDVSHVVLVDRDRPDRAFGVPDAPSQCKAESSTRLHVDGIRVGSAIFARELEVHGEVRMRGAKVDGPVDFAGAVLDNPGTEALSAENLDLIGGLFLTDGFVANGSISLVGAHIKGGLYLADAKINNAEGIAVDAHGAQVAPGIEGRRLKATGSVLLVGARIEGPLDLAFAKLEHDVEPALDGSRAHIGGNCELGEIQAKGEMRFAEATVRGSLAIPGTEIMNPGGPALAADGLDVKGAFIGRFLRAIGEVRLVRARVGGVLSLDDAELVADELPSGSGPEFSRSTFSRERLDGFVAQRSARRERILARDPFALLNATVEAPNDPEGYGAENAPRPALNATGLRVESDVFARRMRTNGEVRMASANVDGQLDFDGSELFVEEPRGTTLSLVRTRARSIRLPHEPPPVGLIDLTDCTVGRFDDHWYAASDHATHTFRLTGFHYERLGSWSDGRADRLHWLREADGGFDPRQYDQLDRVFREAGREEDARVVAVEKQRQRRRQLNRSARALSLIADLMVGYGYRTWRAMYALLLVVAFEWVVIAWGFPERFTALKPADQLPQFASWLYALDTVLPVVNLGQEAAWTPTGAMVYVYAFGVLAGWLLVTALFAALTASAIKK